MQLPNYGIAHHLVSTFLFTRITQFVCFIVIIGLSANFCADVAASGTSPPKEIIGTLAIASLIMLYCLIAIPFFWTPAYFGLLVMTVIDSVALICFIAISVNFGKPLSYIDCFSIGSGSATGSGAATYSMAWTPSQGLSNFGPPGSLLTWAMQSRANCFETKTVWGLCVAEAILFTCTIILLPSIWFRARQAKNEGGD